MKKHLLLIDPQRGFAEKIPLRDQQSLMDGELCVDGGLKALGNVANAVTVHSRKLDDWTITYDSHQEIHIAHPMWFAFAVKPAEQYVIIDGISRQIYDEMFVRNVKTYVPAPFTTIIAKDGGMVCGLLDGKGQFHEVSSIQCLHLGFTNWTVKYLESLAAGGRYPHMIWPPHCRIGTRSHGLVDSIRDARAHWERTRYSATNPITKGSNIKCEHFGAVRAEVIDPDDPSTMPNSHFIGLMSDDSQEIGIAGLARGHCLANTARDLAHSFPEPEKFFKRMVLLTDGTADVTNLEFLGDAFVKEATGLGMRLATCEEWLSS